VGDVRGYVPWNGMRNVREINVVRVKSSQPRVGMLFVNIVCVDISPNSSLQLDTYLLIQAN
jgi:hypothetical protein